MPRVLGFRALHEADPSISTQALYRHEELARFFAACSDTERALFATFLLTGFREQEVMFLRWSDVNFELRTVRVTSKPELGFYPKRWEDREIPAPCELIEQRRK